MLKSSAEIFVQLGVEVLILPEVGQMEDEDVQRVIKPNKFTKILV